LSFIEEFIGNKLNIKKVNGLNNEYFINKMIFTYRIDELMRDNEELQKDLKLRLIEETKRSRG